MKNPLRSYRLPETTLADIQYISGMLGTTKTSAIIVALRFYRLHLNNVVNMAKEDQLFTQVVQHEGKNHQ